MKMSNQLVFSVLLISCSYIAHAGDLVATNGEADLPTHVGTYMVSSDVREAANKFATPESRVAYLSSVIASNAVDTNEVENFKKSSAIRLVSVIKSTNSIAILVSNIDFVDAKYPERPAYYALEVIGDPAVPYLLDTLKDPSASPEQVKRVLEVLRYVKRAKYNPDQWEKFIEEEKKVLPPELRGRIDRKVWVDD